MKRCKTLGDFRLSRKEKNSIRIFLCSTFFHYFWCLKRFPELIWWLELTELRSFNHRQKINLDSVETKYVNKQKWVGDRESSFSYVSVHKPKADDELGSSMTLPSFLVAALFEERGIQQYRPFICK